MDEPELERDRFFVRRDADGLKVARFDASTRRLSFWRLGEVRRAPRRR